MDVAVDVAACTVNMRDTEVEALPAALVASTVKVYVLSPSGVEVAPSVTGDVHPNVLPNVHCVVASTSVVKVNVTIVSVVVEPSAGPPVMVSDGGMAGGVVVGALASHVRVKLTSPWFSLPAVSLNLCS